MQSAAQTMPKVNTAKQVEFTGTSAACLPKIPTHPNIKMSSALAPEIIRCTPSVLYSVSERAEWVTTKPRMPLYRRQASNNLCIPNR